MTTEKQATHPTVLVVDDDVYSLDLARFTLSSLGVTQVHIAYGGAEGLRVLDGRLPKPDFIICDIFMPDMDGIEFIGALVKRRYQGGLIVISSGDATMLSIAHQLAFESGLNVCASIVKPLQPDGLRQALQDWVTD